jgi:hypothetical protein
MMKDYAAKLALVRGVTGTCFDALLAVACCTLTAVCSRRCGVRGAASGPEAGKACSTALGSHTGCRAHTASP